MSRNSGAVLRQIDRIFNRGTVSGMTEGQLLDRFVATGDEAAFSALVSRHGPMVLGVCRRVLRDEHDVEDAFQATFLVLVRRAGSVRRPDLLGNWLYGVARRVAIRARATGARKRIHEQPVASALAEAAAPVCNTELRELRAVLDEELARLPEWLRVPLVMCYLDGLSHDEAARRLRWPVGTVRSRMARARDVLRQRLARRGMVATGAVLTSSLAAQSVPAALLTATVRASLGFAARQATAAGVASAAATALAKGVLHAMTISKWKVLSAATLACVLAVGGVQGFAYQFGGTSDSTKRARVVPRTGDPQSAPLRSVDKIQADLVELARRNAELQKEVQDLRAELEALRAGQPPATEKVAGAEENEKKPQSSSVAGGTNRSTLPQYSRFGNLLIIVSPDGDKVTAYNTETGNGRAIRLAASKEARLSVGPVFPVASGSLVPLRLTGPAITQVAVFSITDGKWYTQELRESFNGTANPIATLIALFMGEKARVPVSQTLVIYHLGRYVYTFQSMARSWDVLELPTGVGATVVTAPGGRPIVESDGHVYEFDIYGRWKDIDLRAVLDASAVETKADTEPKK
jgi:RNA polymerase sigma factor (sigma-70 family)